jgi:hypothetical protein
MNASNTKTARAEALARGDKTFQGAPCKRGGHLERYTSNGKCVMCQKATYAAWYVEHREQRNAATAAWYVEHREQQKAAAAAWYAAHTKQANATSAAWRKANREQAKATGAAWLKAHPEQKKATDAAWRKAHLEQKKATNAAWRKANREQAKATGAAWAKENPGAKRASVAKRRALKKSQRCPVTCCTDAQIAEKYKQAALCGAGAHVDHILALELGGAHCVKNLMPMTAEDHIEKTKIDAGLIADARRKRKRKQQGTESLSGITITGTKKTIMMTARGTPIRKQLIFKGL